MSNYGNIRTGGLNHLYYTLGFTIDSLMYALGTATSFQPTEGQFKALDLVDQLKIIHDLRKIELRNN